MTVPCQSNLISSKIIDSDCLELLPWQCMYEGCSRETKLDAWDTVHRYVDVMASGVETENGLLCKPVGL